MPANTTIPSVAELDDIIRSLERLLPELKQYAKQFRDVPQETHEQSYVQLAIAVLAEIGRPTPITVLLERIRQRRNDSTITRGSVETSLLRYLSMKGDKAEFVKAAPGTYVFRNGAQCYSAVAG